MKPARPIANFFRGLDNILHKVLSNLPTEEGLTRKHVIWAYRLFLDREPESEDAILGKLGVWVTTEELRADFISSPEFQSKNPGFRMTDSHGLPVPPSNLIALVAGTSSSVSWFLKGGHLAAQSMVGILERNEVAIDCFDAILDFGCGCGRVIRHLMFAKRAKLYGTDCNPELIDWCKQNLDFAQFAVNDISPPLSYDDSTFDFVYALSVFTHLPEALQFSWMSEMARVLRPGGFLIMTTHGESYLDRLAPEQQEQFQRGQLVVVCEELAGTNACSAFHPERYVHDKLASNFGFSVIDFIPRGAGGNPHQDLFLLIKGRHESQS